LHCHILCQDEYFKNFGSLAKLKASPLLWMRSKIAMVRLSVEGSVTPKPAPSVNCMPPIDDQMELAMDMLLDVLALC